MMTESHLKAPADDQELTVRQDDQSDLAYWAKRAMEERAKAEDPACSARSVHSELAERYAELVAKARGTQRAKK